MLGCLSRGLKVDAAKFLVFGFWGRGGLGGGEGKGLGGGELGKIVGGPRITREEEEEKKEARTKTSLYVYVCIYV